MIKDLADRKAYNAAKYQANKEVVKARAKLWAGKNLEKVRASDAKYKEENPDKIRENAAKHREKNPGRFKAKAASRTRKWRAENPEKAMEARKRHEASRPARTLTPAQQDRKRRLKAKSRAENPGVRLKDKEYRQRNLARYRALGHKYRARKLQAAPAWGDSELTKFVVEEAAFLATDREGAFGFKWEIDHVIPLQGRTVSGLHIWSNIQVIPATLNRKKSNNFAPAQG